MESRDPYWTRLLELLERYSVERREVVLASGRKSSFYIDCRRTLLTAEGLFLAGRLLHRLLREEFPEVQVVGGRAVGAVPLVATVCQTSFLASRSIEGFYVRKEPKNHGTGRLVEASGGIRPGAPAVILEDVVTTGGSCLEAAAAAERELEVRVLGIVALVDREEGGAERIAGHYPFRALYRKRQFPSLRGGASGP